MSRERERVPRNRASRTRDAWPEASRGLSPRLESLSLFRRRLRPRLRPKYMGKEVSDTKRPPPPSDLMEERVLRGEQTRVTAFLNRIATAVFCTCVVYSRAALARKSQSESLCSAVAESSGAGSASPSGRTKSSSKRQMLTQNGFDIGPLCAARICQSGGVEGLHTPFKSGRFLGVFFIPFF